MAAAERKELIHQPLKKIWDAITDYESYPEFVTGMKETRVLSQEGHKKKVKFDLEMMKRLDYVVEIQGEVDSEYQSGKVWWTLVQSDFFKVNNGWWFLKSLGPSQTEVIYKIELDFSFPVPGFILKGLISKALPAAILDFSNRAAQIS